MPIASGQVITADILNHLKPTVRSVASTANLAGIVVDTDVTGATLTFDTETDNAVYEALGFFYMLKNGASTGLADGKLSVDGTIVPITDGFAVFQQAAGNVNDRATVAMGWTGTLATAGTHTIKLVASLPDADDQVRAGSKLVLRIYETV